MGCGRVNENGGRLWHAELITSIQKHEEARINLRAYALRVTDALKQVQLILRGSCNVSSDTGTACMLVQYDVIPPCRREHRMGSC